MQVGRKTFPPLICTVAQKSAPAIDHLAQLFLRAECLGCVLISIAGSANRPVSLPRLLPEAAARAMKLIITENAVKIGGTAAPWVYEIKNEGPHTRGPNDYWQLHMRGEKEMLTFNYYRTTAKLVRNDGTVEEVPILITENITGGKEHRAYIDMNRRLERMDRIYNEPAPR